jgi:hypothetical protein
MTIASACHRRPHEYTARYSTKRATPRSMTAALLERFANEPHTRLRSFCSPQHTDSAFYPIIGQMEGAAALSRNDSLQVKLDKLDAMLAPSSTSALDAGLLAEMLSLPNDGRYPVLDLTPQQRRRRTLEPFFRRLSPCRAKIHC